MRGNWWGLAGEQVYRRFGRLSTSEVISGIPGSPTNHHTAPYAITQHTFATTLARLSGRELRGHISAGLLKAVLGELATALLDDQRVIPERAVAANFQFQYPAWRAWTELGLEHVAVPARAA